MIVEVRRKAVAGVAAAAAIGTLIAFDRLVVIIGSPAGGLVVASAVAVILAVAGIGAWWPGSRRHAALITTVVAIGSITVSVTYEPRVAPRDAFWIVGEAAAFVVLIALVVRWSTLGAARVVGALAGVAMTLTLIRVNAAPMRTEVIGAFIAWGAVAAGAAALGVYLRVLDNRRSRLVTEARRAQRLELARDLHDFVAHDVTGMVVQAQAAQVIAQQNPNEAFAALARIEESGQHALGALDRTVRMLGDLSVEQADDTRPAAVSERLPSSRTLGLRDVFDLVGRFTSIDRAPVHLHVDPTVEAQVPREVSGTIHRVVSEALTNVRRHAPSAARVEVSIAPVTAAAETVLAVRVINESVTAPARTPGDRGGTGLVGLAERVEAVGGTFTFGPVDGAPNVWHVTAVFPLAGRGR